MIATLATREAPVQFRPGPLAGHLDRRGGKRNETAARDLARYYATLDRELARVELTEGEAALLVDVLNGVIVDDAPHMLWAEIDDAIRLDGADARWGVDGPALVAKLRALTPTQALAVADAAERWWRLAGGVGDRAGENLRRGASFAVVGLVR